MRGPSNLPGRSIHRRCFVKNMFLEISQNLQENACTRASFLINTLVKKRLWHRCFPVNFAKFLRTPFLQKNSGRLREKWSCSELFLSPFSRIRTDTERYLVRMQENTDQNNSEYGQFLNSSQDQKIVSAGEIIFGSLGAPWVDHL